MKVMNSYFDSTHADKQGVILLEIGGTYMELNYGITGSEFKVSIYCSVAYSRERHPLVFSHKSLHYIQYRLYIRTFITLQWVIIKNHDI